MQPAPYQIPHSRRGRLWAALCLLCCLGALLYHQNQRQSRQAAQQQAHATAALLQQAQQGSAEAQYQLGRFYSRRNDWAQAVPWYQQAAAQGHPKAQNNLGVAYMEGLGTPAKPQEGCRLLAAAAMQMPGIQSADNVGLCNDHPAVGNHDHAFAAYQQAAALGSAQSQRNLANMHETGEGTPVNLPAAVYWYRRAALQEDAQAMYALALMYARNQGVTEHKNNPLAAYVLMKAAQAKQTDDDAKQFTRIRFEANLSKLEKRLPPEAQAVRMLLELLTANQPMPRIIAELDKLVPYQPPAQMP